MLRGLSGSLSTSATATSAEALAIRSLVYIKADGTLALADATIEGKEAIGFVDSAHSISVTATVKLEGKISGLSGLTAGAKYYMSTTPGALATSAAAALYTTGNVVLPVGTALSATELVLSIGLPITL